MSGDNLVSPGLSQKLPRAPSSAIWFGFVRNLSLLPLFVDKEVNGFIGQEPVVKGEHDPVVFNHKPAHKQNGGISAAHAHGTSSPDELFVLRRAI